MNPVKKFRALSKGSFLPDPIDLTDPEHRRLAHLHYTWFDHAILRRPWTNFFEIAPGVFRSNQPSHERFETYAKMGLKTVINLRGKSPDRPSYLFEQESCARLGLDLIDLTLEARGAPNRDNLLQLITLFRELERPFLFHCKSGADRAGMASAVYKLVIENAPVAEAKQMLSLKYIHLKWTKTGILGYFLDIYGARTAKSEIAFEDWLRDEYDPQALSDGFKNGRKIPS